jgi:hypothetical protein
MPLQRVAQSAGHARSLGGADECNGNLSCDHWSAGDGRTRENVTAGDNGDPEDHGPAPTLGATIMPQQFIELSARGLWTTKRDELVGTCPGEAAAGSPQARLSFTV